MNPLADFQRVIDVNLVGSFNVLPLFAGGLLALDAPEGGEGGVIVNTASVVADAGRSGGQPVPPPSRARSA